MNTPTGATSTGLLYVYVDSAAAALTLGISATAIWRLGCTGRLDGIRTRIGRAWRFHIAKLVRAAEAGELDLTSR